MLRYAVTETTVPFTLAAFSILLVALAWRLTCWYFLSSPLDVIPGPPSLSFLSGNLARLVDTKLGWNYNREISEKYGPVSRIHGVLGSRGLYVYDPKLLRGILIDKHVSFDMPRWILAQNAIVFGPGLFASAGTVHRKQRKLLNPSFSLQHLKKMSPAFYAVAHQLHAAIIAQLREGTYDIDILNATSRAALETIVHVGASHSFDSLSDLNAPLAPIAKAVKEFIPALSTLEVFRPFLEIFRKMGTKHFRRTLIGYMPLSNVQWMKWIADTFANTASNIVHDRLRGEQTCSESAAKDILESLLKPDLDTPDKEEIVAQISSLIFGGTDTTSNAVSRILQLLAENPDIQCKLRRELSEAAKGEDFAYDELMQLPYLDAVIRETLRLYPPVPLALREANRDISLPVAGSVFDVNGHVLEQIVIPKGTLIFISIISANRSEALWGEDANEWRPDRWLSPLPDSISEARIPGIYSNLMTFLAGPRSCIGFNFSQVEIKILLAMLVKSFKFSLTGEDIQWRLSAVNFPVMGGREDHPSLILRLQEVSHSSS